MRRAVAQVSYGCSLRHRSMGDGGEFLANSARLRQLPAPADADRPNIRWLGEADERVEKIKEDWQIGVFRAGQS